MRTYKLFFFILVLFLLVLPLLHMNTAEITEQENRTLAKFPETIKKNKPNYEFGKEFESWLGDRFWGRDKLIVTHFQMIYKINGRIENDKAFVGDDGWMFMKNGIVNVPSLEKQREEIEKYADILKRFDDKFKGKNIPIYLVLVPDRNQLYQKYWERYYTAKPRLDYRDELIKVLKDHPNIHIIYPKKEFITSLNQKKDVFRKYDYHMNNNGAKVLVDSVYLFLKNNFSNLKKNIPFNIILNDKSSKKNWPPNIANELYVYTPPEYTQSIKIKNSKKIETKENYFNKFILVKNQYSSIHKKVYIFGGCNNYNTLFPLIKNLFTEVTMIRTNNLENIYSDQIKKSKNLYNHMKKKEIIFIIGEPFTLDFINKTIEI